MELWAVNGFMSFYDIIAEKVATGLQPQCLNDR